MRYNVFAEPARGLPALELSPAWSAQGGSLAGSGTAVRFTGPLQIGAYRQANVFLSGIAAPASAAASIRGLELRVTFQDAAQGALPATCVGKEGT